MAIPDPRDLPAYVFTESTFELLEGVVAAAFAGGTRINRSQTTDPVWKAKWVTGVLDMKQAGEFSAFMRSLRGGLRTFVAYDVWRYRLLAYANARAPGDCVAGWNGTGTVSSIGAGGALSVAGLPSALKLSPGDRLGLEENGRFGYYEILEGRTGSGPLNVAPFIQPIFTTAAVVRLWQPKVKFVVDWTSWSQPGQAGPTAASFEAFQVLS